jgi:hypothetical protein
MLCPGSHVLQMGARRTTSTYSAEGTAAHQLLTWALQDNNDARAYLGRVIEADGMTFTVDEDMAGYVQVTIDYVRDVAGSAGVVLVDRRVNYSTYLDVPEQEAWGTLDVAVLLADEIVAIDLKYGRGVEVEAGSDLIDGNVALARPNPQLALYALGALQEFGDFGDFTRVRLAISQPRIHERPSEYDMSVDELERWARSTARSAVLSCRAAAQLHGRCAPLEDDPGTWESTFLRPGEKQCRFCKAKATCPALRDDVADTIGIDAAGPDEFADSSVPSADHIAPTDAWLAAALAKVDMIEDWCKAIRAETERRLLAGQNVPGFKLVQGKRGPRHWSDPAQAEKLLRETFRLPVEKAFDLKLISPTSAEKLHKAGDIGPRQWPKAQELITQSDGKPHVAPVSDSRPALVVTPVVDDFDTVTTDASEFA